MFSSTVCRCSGRECWNTMPTPSRAIRCDGQPATSTPSIRTEPASGRSIPMMSFITVDLPEPFGPIRPRILPAWIRERHVLDGDQAAEALGEAADFEKRAGRLAHALSFVRVSRPKKPPGNSSTTTSAIAKTMKFDEIAERPQRLAHGDQKDRAEHGAENGAAAADHRGDDDLDADGDVDESVRPRPCRDKTPAARRRGRRRTR